MKNVPIDVIVPVYNNESFIQSIINTLEAQTMKDFRVIFVDDGSTDNSLKFLQEQLTDSSLNSMVIHQENKGLPGARNTGIRASDAQWVIFVDCDDRLDSHYVEHLYRSVNENHTFVGCCRYRYVTDKQSKIKAAGKYDCAVFSSTEFIKRYYTEWVGVWCFILNREWLLSNNLLFDEACTYCEDVPFITRVILTAEQVAMNEEVLYLYYIREDSLMHTPNIQKYQTALDGFERMSQKVSCMHGNSAEVFRAVGKIRYYIAILRKEAVSMPYSMFALLCKRVPIKAVKYQLKNLSVKHRIACRIFFASRQLFYCIARIRSKE